jgi:catechol 2,3-dioxygenase-like lactoylglutathione lyase family enzyme
MFDQIDHVNFVVHDLEGMTTFYSEVLGFRVTKTVTISGAWIDAVVGLDNVVADVVYLEPPNGPRIELIRYKKPTCIGSQEPSSANTFGLRHLAFRVSNIDAAMLQLEQAGIRANSLIATVPTSQVQYAGAQKRLVYFYDPEGNILELCEYKA